MPSQWLVSWMPRCFRHLALDNKSKGRKSEEVKWNPILACLSLQLLTSCVSSLNFWSIAKKTPLMARVLQKTINPLKLRCLFGKYLYNIYTYLLVQRKFKQLSRTFFFRIFKCKNIRNRTFRPRPPVCPSKETQAGDVSVRLPGRAGLHRLQSL